MTNVKTVLKGNHLIAGEWVGGPTTFTNEPVSGDADHFADGTPALVDKAAKAAEEAFWSYGYSSREERAVFLRAIADEIDAYYHSERRGGFNVPG